MEKMKIKTPSGEYPLMELADYHMERGPVAINRYNGSREIRVEAETVDPYASVPEILEEIELRYHAGYPFKILRDPLYISWTAAVQQGGR